MSTSLEDNTRAKTNQHWFSSNTVSNEGEKKQEEQMTMGPQQNNLATEQMTKKYYLKLKFK